MPWIKHELFRKADGINLDLELVSTKALHGAAEMHLNIRSGKSVSIGEILGKLNCPEDEAKKIIDNIANKVDVNNRQMFKRINTQEYKKHKPK